MVRCMKKRLFLLIFCFVQIQLQAQQTPHYGRLYNVQDFIDHAPDDLTGINRCLSTISQRAWSEAEKPGDMSDIVYTIVFPRRTYIINDAMGPIKVTGKAKKMIFERNITGGNPNRRVIIQLIGLTVDQAAFKSTLSKYVPKPQTDSKTDYSSDVLNQFYWVAQSFMANGIDISAIPAMRSYIDANTGRTNIKCTSQPSQSNFLTAKASPMPVIQSNSAERHMFFILKTQGINSEEPSIYPKINSRQLHNTLVEIRGMTLEGISSSTNSHIYDPQSVQQNQTFHMGFAIYLENMKGANVRNMVIQNMYGNGIYIMNKFYALENASVVVDSNVLQNVWGIKYRRVCSNGGYDDTGYGICFVGINGGQSRYNIIHNNVAITKQAGAIALASCSEHNRNCEAGYNSLKGYDRLIHVENGLSGFNIHHNRCTGSETGIVFDGNRDYKARSCPPVNPSSVQYNYVSNEELVYNPFLQKIYPQQLFFASGAFRTNEYNGTVISNNTFVINKQNIYTYSSDNRSICNTKDPRPYNFNDNAERYHIKSGIRRQIIRCNTFKVINASIKLPFVVGGTFLNSYCADEILDPNPCPVPPGEASCGFVHGQSPQQNPRLINESLPLELSGNKYFDCEKVYLQHANSSKNNLFNNTFNVAPGSNSSPDIKLYKQVKPGKPCL